jgi:hypothetical protein
MKALAKSKKLTLKPSAPGYAASANRAFGRHLISPAG